MSLKSAITCHVLDTSSGKPAGRVGVLLQKSTQRTGIAEIITQWKTLASGWVLINVCVIKCIVKLIMTEDAQLY